MEGTIRIVGDIVGPISSEDDWDAVSRMNLLLDTHIWIWSVGEPQAPYFSCGKTADEYGKSIWLSPVSVWEVQFLYRKRRIELEGMDVETWTTKSAGNPSAE